MMYGKQYGTMYEGSMIGIGAMAFAVMGYVISKQRPDKVVGSYVELNTKLLGPIFGEDPEKVARAIEQLCAPDPETRTPGHEGRRLVKLGTYAYQVVNGAKYMAIRDEDARREQNRTAQRRFRARAKPESTKDGTASIEQLLASRAAAEGTRRRKVEAAPESVVEDDGWEQSGPVI